MIVELVEGVKKLLLGALLVAEQLDVVHQQNIGLAKARAKLFHALRANAGDHFVHESLA